MSPRVLDLVNFMVLLCLSTAMHEYAHAWLATRFGDDTPRNAGRLTFNPFVHLDPFFSVLLPAYVFWTTGGVMAAAWTPVNPFRMRNPRVHMPLTALGGPAMNFLLAVASFAVLAAFMVAQGGYDPDGRGQRLCMLALHMNLFLGMFNFLPVPPLDGGSLIPLFLPARLQGTFWRWKPYSMILFVVLLVSGALQAVLEPANAFAHDLTRDAVYALDSVIRG